MRRDTIDVPAGGSATLRIIADNPGAWFMHCHIEWHLESGLAIQLIEAPLVAQERSEGRVPSIMAEHCNAVGMRHTGNAAGHNSAEDLSGWPLGPKPKGDGLRTGKARKMSGGLYWYWLAYWHFGAIAGYVLFILQ